MYIMTEDGRFALPLDMSGTNIFADTRTPTSRELQECPHIVLCLPHHWDPKNVQFPKASRTLEEEIDMQRIVGAILPVCVGSVGPETAYNEEDVNPADVIFDIGDINQRILKSVRVSEAPPVRIAPVETQAQVQDVPAAKTFQSKGCHTDVSPEDLSERWHISWRLAKETLLKGQLRCLSGQR